MKPGSSILIIVLTSLVVSGFSIASGSISDSFAFFILRLILLVLAMGGMALGLYIAINAKELPTKRISSKKAKAGIRTLIEEGEPLLVDLNETNQVTIAPLDSHAIKSPQSKGFVLIYENPELKLKFQSEPVFMEEGELRSRIQRWGHTQIFRDKDDPEQYYFDTDFLKSEKLIH